MDGVCYHQPYPSWLPGWLTLCTRAVKSDPQCFINGDLNIPCHLLINPDEGAEPRGSVVSQYSGS